MKNPDQMTKAVGQFDESKATYFLAKLKYNAPELLVFDQNTEWMAKILSELNEPLEEGDVLYSKETPFIRFKGEVVKKKNPQYGDIVLVMGDLDAAFVTTCIQTGKPMIDTIDVDVRACYISNDSKKRYGHDDEIDIVVDDQEFDLFFYNDEKLDIYEVLREYVFLNKNPYPVISKQE